MSLQSSTAGLAIGVTACGLGLVVAGVLWHRRKRAGGAAASAKDEMEDGIGVGNDERIQGEDEDPPVDREVQTNTHCNAPEGKLLLEYFILTVVLAIPFWLFGGAKLPLPINLPVGALATFVPMIAASMVSYRQSGFSGVKGLLQQALDFRKIGNSVWYLPALLLMPLVSLMSFAVMRLTGLALPDPVQIPLLIVPVFLVMFLIGGVGEELGWMGLAIDPMQNRLGALNASLLLGIVWVIWHIIPWVQTGNPTDWIVWQSLFSVALRLVIVWIYNNTGKSVFAANLVHVTSNLSWSLFPNYGSHYSPLVTALITWLVAGIVVIGWGPKTLSRYRWARIHSTA